MRVWKEPNPETTTMYHPDDHPVIVLYLAQITHLATGGLIDIYAYYKASDLCRAVIDEKGGL